MKRIFAVLLIALAASGAIRSAPVLADESLPPYYAVTTVELGDGSRLEQAIISGPPRPPSGRAAPAIARPVPDAAGGIASLSVPAYGWTFGCSATSAAMIAAYYDRSGFPNIYTGPTGGGVMPMDSSVWPRWTDDEPFTYDQCPLAASRVGLDGRTGRGSIDDYWVAYGSAANDPYIAGVWAEHAFSDAIGDYMRTSQSAFGNTDGSTAFHNWSNLTAPLTCADMEAQKFTHDGTYGRRLFYQARGYTVTDCYNQKVDTAGGAFSFAMYRAEIDAGRPVLLNLAGHSVVGVGYDTATSTVYLHDTWDFALHSMAWGGSYESMSLRSVSIVNILAPAPAAVTVLALDALDATRVEVTWAPVDGADHYEFWATAGGPHLIPGADCDEPGDAECTRVAGAGFVHEAPAGSSGPVTFAVRAVSASGAASSGPHGRAGVFRFVLAPGS